MYIWEARRAEPRLPSLPLGVRNNAAGFCISTEQKPRLFLFKEFFGDGDFVPGLLAATHVAGGFVSDTG
jgi:hypothetical protein